jgi:hypothetical protein
MGVSTDAMIFYRYTWKDQTEAVPEDAEEDWKGDVAVMHHGSDEWRVPYVYIKASEVRASRGYPQDLPEDALTTRKDWIDKLDAFVQKHNIDLSEAEGPNWFLASWWG